MHALVDDSTLDDVLLTLRLAALFTPGRELTADEVALTCWISRPPSCFQMSEKGAAEALKELVKDGYAVARRARKNLYKLDPADRRPPLPNGFRYARRIHYASDGTRDVFEVVVAPFWVNGKDRHWLTVRGGEVRWSQLFRLTWQHQTYQSHAPLTEAQARYWLKTRAHPGWTVDGDAARCPVSDHEGLRALFELSRTVEIRGAAAVENRLEVVALTQRAQREAELARIAAQWRA